MNRIIKDIIEVLDCDEAHALVVREVMEDYLDPDYSEMTDSQFAKMVKEAESLMAEVL